MTTDLDAIVIGAAVAGEVAVSLAGDVPGQRLAADHALRGVPGTLPSKIYGDYVDHHHDRP